MTGIEVVISVSYLTGFEHNIGVLFITGLVFVLRVSLHTGLVHVVGLILVIGFEFLPVACGGGVV